MAEVIYALCAATSFLCFVLLARGYRARRSALLLWSSVAFFFFTASNVLLFLDMIVFRELDLMFYRTLLNLIGILVLLPRLIREAVRHRPDA